MGSDSHTLKQFEDIVVLLSISGLVWHIFVNLMLVRAHVCVWPHPGLLQQCFERYGYRAKPLSAREDLGSAAFQYTSLKFTESPAGKEQREKKKVIVEITNNNGNNLW